MADLSTLQLRLAEAEVAYHKLQCGAMQAQVEHDDMKVVYTAANVDKLRAYIADLKSQIALLQGDTTSAARRRPLYVEL